MNSVEYLRQFRLGGFAAFDLTVAFLGMLLLAPFLSLMFSKVGIRVPKRNWVILTLPVGILVHVLVGSITPLTKDFLDLGGHYLTKLIIIGCCIFGFVGIRRIKPTSKVRA
jgi:hypothetical protein